MAYKKPIKSPSEPEHTTRPKSTSQSLMQRSQSIAKSRSSAPPIPKPYLQVPPAPSVGTKRRTGGAGGLKKAVAARNRAVPKRKPYTGPTRSSSTRTTAKSKPALPKGTVRTPSKGTPAPRTKAYKATKGTSSKRAVQRVAGKVMSRQLQKDGITSTSLALKQARRIVRKRKVTATSRKRG